MHGYFPCVCGELQSLCSCPWQQQPKQQPMLIKITLKHQYTQSEHWVLSHCSHQELLLQTAQSGQTDSAGESHGCRRSEWQRPLLGNIPFIICCIALLMTVSNEYKMNMNINNIWLWKAERSHSWTLISIIIIIHSLSHTFMKLLQLNSPY